MIQVSIIIPMYNVAHFLDKCVDSVLKQHLDPGRFEILMIDDGSPDDSKAVATKIAENFTNVRVFSQTNKGLGGARNTGIANALGKFLIFLDADDLLLNNGLSQILALAETNDLEILEFGATQIDESGTILFTITKDTHNKVYNGIDYYKEIKYMNSACNKLYSRRFLIDNNLLFTEKIYAEDFEFNTRSFYFSQRIMATSILGAAFLQSPNSITRNKDKNKKDKFISDFILILKKIQDFRLRQADLEKKVNTPDINEYFEDRLAMCNLGLFYFMFKNKYPYAEMKKIRLELQSEGVYRNNIAVNDKKREAFRRILLRNFFLFKIIQPLKRII